MALGITGVVMVVFGGILVMSCLYCIPLWLIPLASLGLSIPAWVMGQKDLAAMKAGEMDPSGRDNTMVGMIAGIVGVALVGAGVLLFLAIIAFYAVLISAEIANQ